MMTLEFVQDLPSSDKFGPGGPWVKVLPYPAPLICRLRDAWEVLLGRAEAVRESTIDDFAAWPAPETHE